MPFLGALLISPYPLTREDLSSLSPRYKMLLLLLLLLMSLMWVTVNQIPPPLSSEVTADYTLHCTLRTGCLEAAAASLALSSSQLLQWISVVRKGPCKRLGLKWNDLNLTGNKSTGLNVSCGL